MTLSRENFSPCSWRSPGFMPICAGPPLPISAVRVTVMSVPTPYSDCSTSSCAWPTPSAYALTATTRPTPTAKPKAVSRAWRCRRRSSR